MRPAVLAVLLLGLVPAVVGAQAIQSGTVTGQPESASGLASWEGNVYLLVGNTLRQFGPDLHEVRAVELPASNQTPSVVADSQGVYVLHDGQVTVFDHNLQPLRTAKVAASAAKAAPAPAAVPAAPEQGSPGSTGTPGANWGVPVNAPPTTAPEPPSGWVNTGYSLVVMPDGTVRVVQNTEWTASPAGGMGPVEGLGEYSTDTGFGYNPPVAPSANYGMYSKSGNVRSPGGPGPVVSGGTVISPPPPRSPGAITRVPSTGAGAFGSTVSPGTPWSDIAARASGEANFGYNPPLQQPEGGPPAPSAMIPTGFAAPLAPSGAGGAEGVGAPATGLSGVWSNTIVGASQSAPGTGGFSGPVVTTAVPGGAGVSGVWEATGWRPQGRFAWMYQQPGLGRGDVILIGRRGLTGGSALLGFSGTRQGGPTQLHLNILNADNHRRLDAMISASVYPTENPKAGNAITFLRRSTGDFVASFDPQALTGDLLAVRVQRPGLADEVVVFSLAQQDVTPH